MNKKADTPAAESTPRIPATQLFNKLLSENKLVIVQSKLDDDIKHISDGSIIIARPSISVRYTDE